MSEHSENHGQGPIATAQDQGVVALSSSEFAALEERILRTVEVVRKERQSRAAAEERATQAEAQVRELTPQVAQLEQELNRLRAERDHVRGRVERLLGQLDALEL
jgi:chromosome segregation ATPase